MADLLFHKKAQQHLIREIGKAKILKQNPQKTLAKTTMPRALTKISALGAEFIDQEPLLRIRGGKCPLRSKKAKETAPEASRYSTRSRTETVLAADKSKAEEKRRICFEDTSSRLASS
jgi:hypothetical protein